MGRDQKWKEKRFTDCDDIQSRYKRRIAEVVRLSFTSLTFSSSSEELVQDREKWEPFRGGGSKKKKKRSEGATYILG